MGKNHKKVKKRNLSSIIKELKEKYSKSTSKMPRNNLLNCKEKSNINNKKILQQLLFNQNIQMINNNQNFEIKFDNEIKNYVKNITPKGITLKIREITELLLQRIISKVKPKWKILLYGSYPQKISTVFSDLDFSIITDFKTIRTKEIEILKYLRTILLKEKFSINLMLIKAKVPIIRCTCKITGINIDISINRRDGYNASKIIRSVLEDQPLIKNIIIILKMILKSHELNDAHLGGMNSFLLFHLVYSFYIKIINEIKYDECGENIRECRYRLLDSNSDYQNSYKNISNNYKSFSEIINFFSQKINSKNIFERNYINNCDYNIANKLRNINNGIFLYKFLKYYGKDFDESKFEINLENNKIAQTKKLENCNGNNSLVVRSFQDNKINIGNSCQKYYLIKKLFSELSEKIEIIKFTYNYNRYDSILLNLGL